MIIPKSIALVDYSHMLTVNFKSGGKSQGPNDAENQTMVQLAGIRSACESVVVCLDSKPYKRSEQFPAYKAQREREPELVAMWRRCVERLAVDGYQTAKAPGAEADDVIATLARLYCDAVEGYGCQDVRIYGTDKDCLQCVNDHVRCFSYTGRGEWEIRDLNWVVKKWKVPPKDIPLLLAIMGDDSDNIPGIDGIGAVGAAKLISAYKNPEGMAAALANAVEDSKITGKLPAFWQKYAAGMANLPLWWKLTTLDSNVELDKHPLKYLEKLEMKPLVKTEDNAFDGAFDDGPPPEDVDWDEIEAKVEAETREQMAASLPVGPAPKPTEERRQEVADHVQHSYPKTKRDEALKAADKVLNPPKASSAPPATPVPKSAHVADAPANGVTADPKADAPIVAKEPASASASNAEPKAGTTEVVPKSQGPQEPKAPMVVVPPPSWELAVQPRSVSEMRIVAQDFFNSRFYAQHNNWNGVQAVIALGRELGLGMAASLEGFHIVNSRPYAKATMLKALAERDPNCEWIMVTSADDKQATIETKHRKIDKVLSYQYTIERAAKAGLLTGNNRHNWEKIPQEMCEARATAKAVRRWYPSCTFGMTSAEEAGDD